MKVERKGNQNLNISLERKRESERKKWKLKMYFLCKTETINFANVAVVAAVRRCT